MIKFVRLLPLAVVIAGVIGSLYVMSSDVAKHAQTLTVQWEKIGNNKDSINALKAQTGVIEYRLNSIDEKLAEQKIDTKEILRQVKK